MLSFHRIVGALAFFATADGFALQTEYLNFLTPSGYDCVLENARWRCSSKQKDSVSIEALAKVAEGDTTIETLPLEFTPNGVLLSQRSLSGLVTVRSHMKFFEEQYNNQTANWSISEYRSESKEYWVATTLARSGPGRIRVVVTFTYDTSKREDSLPTVEKVISSLRLVAWLIYPQDKPRLVWSSEILKLDAKERRQLASHSKQYCSTRPDLSCETRWIPTAQRRAPPGKTVARRLM